MPHFLTPRTLTMHRSLLLKVRLPFLDVETCQTLYEAINPVNEDMLCTFHNTSSGMKDACKVLPVLGA